MKYILFITIFLIIFLAFLLLMLFHNMKIKNLDSSPTKSDNIDINIYDDKKNISEELKMLTEAKIVQELNPEVFEKDLEDEKNFISPEKNNKKKDKSTSAERNQTIEPYIKKELPKYKIMQLNPIKRGGRPRTTIQLPSNNRSIIRTQQDLKSDIICWIKGLEWKFAIELPEDLLGEKGFTITQNGTLLKSDSENNSDNSFILTSPIYEIVIQYEIEEFQKEIRLYNQEEYLLFKLVGKESRRGYRVLNVSTGAYLILAPKTWECSEIDSLPEHITPEPTIFEGYLAHFFYISKKNSYDIVFKKPNNELVRIKYKKHQFELIGNKLEDEDEKVGPLFGGSIPKIGIKNEEGWQQVSMIIVGEEGAGKKKWRTSFNPDKSKTIQDLPEEISKCGNGWFYLRFYDLDNNIIESMDFRYLPELKGIEAPKHFILPQKYGYNETNITLTHSAQFSIQPLESSVKIKIERISQDKTILIIPPDPAFDVSHWLAKNTQGFSVPFIISLKRIWWLKANEEDHPKEWRDSIIELRRDDFSAISNKAIWIKAPEYYLNKELTISFGNAQVRRKCSLTNGITRISLREFGDSIALNSSEDSALLIILPDQKKLKIAKLINYFRCKYCDFIGASQQDVFSHVLQKHLQDIFVSIQFKEMREIKPDLPNTIYKCSYCDFYVPSDEIGSPTTSIEHHIKYECKNVPSDLVESKIKFCIINDIDEIRANVIAELPYIEKCKLCGDIFERESESNKINHLKEKHFKDFYSII